MAQFNAGPLWHLSCGECEFSNTYVQSSEESIPRVCPRCGATEVPTDGRSDSRVRVFGE